MPHQRSSLLGAFVGAAGKVRRQRRQSVTVDGDTCALHLHENLSDWNLHLMKKGSLLAVD